MQAETLPTVGEVVTEGTLTTCMKVKLVCLTALLFLTGCSLFAGPTNTVRKFMDAAKAGDAETMDGLFSSRALLRDGVEKIKSNNQNFATLSQASNSRSSYKMNNITETKVGSDARVGFHYQNADKTDSARMVFALSKEKGTWKIDNIGGPELEDEADITSSAVKDPPLPRVKVEMPPTLQFPPSSDSTPSVTTPRKAPISGGVLNGKAISLPKPPYPPIARAAKASGTVVVQVLVDENGNVVSAHAISGHPLLQAASVVAARGAKFSPTKLAGQPVKVNGVITYNFVAE